MEIAEKIEKNKRSQVPVVHNISRKEFYERFVQPGKPVVIKGAMDNWLAVHGWSAEYFRKKDGNLKITTKKGDIAEGKTTHLTLSEYTVLLENYESMLKIGSEVNKPPYLHDVPIFHLIPSLIPDIQPFPLRYFPKWYWNKWWNYIQFFMGGTGSLTPLHFDTLYTHNLFFQVVGEKKFILIEADQRSKCYVYNWRWSKVDAQNPDYIKFPLFKEAKVAEAIVGPGDIIYMPPGALHQVHGLSFSISFNIDWHTAKSVTQGINSIFKGAPKKNFYYNLIVGLGMYLKIPSRLLFRFYKSYLNYIS